MIPISVLPQLFLFETSHFNLLGQKWGKKTKQTNKKNGRSVVKDAENKKNSTFYEKEKFIVITKRPGIQSVNPTDEKFIYC